MSDPPDEPTIDVVAELSARLGRPPRVAVVHDWLVTAGGAEKLLGELLGLLPGADLYAPVDFLPAADRALLRGVPVRTTFVQRLPRARRWYWYYVPLMALGVEQFDLSGYDLVVSSSHSVAKGVLTGPDQVHVSYVHSSIRYAWDLQPMYLEVFGYQRGPKSALARLAFSFLRLWDVRTGPGVDRYLVNSEFVRRRARKTYARDAVVVHPPIDVDAFTPGGVRGDHYLTASFLNPFKRVDLVVEAFSLTPERRLVVVGDGPDLERVRALAGPNVTFLPRLPLEELRDQMRSARAFVFAALEDFGMVMAEAQACGTPVVAYARGGAAEIVRDLGTAAPTGALFARQDTAALLAALDRFEAAQDAVTAQACRDNALRFAPARFRQAVAREILTAWDDVHAQPDRPGVG